MSECNATYNEVIMEMNRSEIFQRTALVIYSFFNMSDVIRAVKNSFFVLERSQVIQTANGKLEIFKGKYVHRVKVIPIFFLADQKVVV